MPTRSVLLARLRLRFPRGALAYWLAVAVLAALTLLAVNAALRRAHARARALGPPVTVAVATSDLSPGTPLAGHTRLTHRPRGVVPRGALSSVPKGRVATAFIAAGEALVPARVSGTRAAGPAGLVAPGQRALTVPVGPVAPPVRVGDQVDVLATSAAPAAAATPDTVAVPTTGAPATTAPATTHVVVRAALVVATGTNAVTVAVPAAQAPRLAAAIARATVTLALSGPDPGP